jgi:hypothetical protein
MDLQIPASSGVFIKGRLTLRIEASTEEEIV